MFSIICNESLLPNTQVNAANYVSKGTYTLDRDSNVNDICDFVVEYINSDVLVRSDKMESAISMINVLSLNRGCCLIGF